MMSKLFAFLSYQDAPAALDWMERVGFEVVRREDGAGGRVVHAEVRMDSAVLARVLDPQGQEWSAGTCEPGLSGA